MLYDVWYLEHAVITETKSPPVTLAMCFAHTGDIYPHDTSDSCEVDLKPFSWSRSS